MTATSIIGISEINTALLGGIVIKFLYDRFFKKGAIMDSDACAKCRMEIDERLKEGDDCYRRIEKHSKVQTFALYKMCLHLKLDDCHDLERLIKDETG